MNEERHSGADASGNKRGIAYANQATKPDRSLRQHSRWHGRGAGQPVLDISLVRDTRRAPGAHNDNSVFHGHIVGSELLAKANVYEDGLKGARE